MNMHITSNTQYSWVGNEEMCLGEISVKQYGDIVLGRYGGNISAGAKKNEDGAFVWSNGNWEFAIILDSHHSAESVALVIHTIQNESENIKVLLEEPIETVFRSIENHILTIFQSNSFKQACQQVKGETACLICVRKENYIWWFSIGDCLVYVFHEELHKLGQYMLNQRHFYEWIGHVNTFSLPVPCYSSGIRELRMGKSRIVMITDGVLECGERRYENPFHLYQDMYENKPKLTKCVQNVLEHVHHQLGRDSATIISWDYENRAYATYPSDQPEKMRSSNRR
ncbi:protein phosphatase [Bacillus pseudomycoides]|uniref:Protein phosphatase n=1 Tax=Bacillus pseudomycoides TaxID=64104 RepID=A0AA91VC80_9BACI|nr:MULTISPECIES: PP2C family serine/threonine-protein phosphatase [Bacillus]PEB51459.1 protein phosphatase [Bacillus sp. AFS098217]PED82577.1 protein phosphatase [Bacillus pseudomycoides]PEU12133.1 protein phosphatase [Bacillus sp. AFS014408]PEU17683.1 protein phosphatase [Bacillus sp. AFS019443]PFW60941.1 protein phosphatase [Bacillus sp. AFS075034]